MSKQYLDEHGLGVYDENIKLFIATQVTNFVHETTSATAPQSADTGDFWTELINENNND